MGSNCKVWDSKIPHWKYGFIGPWAFQLQLANICGVVLPRLLSIGIRAFHHVSCKWGALVMSSLFCFPRTSQKATEQLACVGVRAAGCNGMLESNCRVWDLSTTLEVWDSSVVFIRLWTLATIFLVWFSQGSYHSLGCTDMIWVSDTRIHGLENTTKFKKL